MGRKWYVSRPYVLLPDDTRSVGVVGQQEHPRSRDTTLSTFHLTSPGFLARLGTTCFSTLLTTATGSWNSCVTTVMIHTFHRVSPESQPVPNRPSPRDASNIALVAQRLASDRKRCDVMARSASAIRSAPAWSRTGLCWSRHQTEVFPFIFSPDRGPDIALFLGAFAH